MLLNNSPGFQIAIFLEFKNISVANMVLPSWGLLVTKMRNKITVKKGDQCGEGRMNSKERRETGESASQSKRPRASAFPGVSKAGMNPISKSAGALQTRRSESQFGPLQIKAAFIFFLRAVKLVADNLLPCWQSMSKFQPHWKRLWSELFQGKEKEKWKKENTHHFHITPAPNGQVDRVLN